MILVYLFECELAWQRAMYFRRSSLGGNQPMMCQVITKVANVGTHFRFVLMAFSKIHLFLLGLHWRHIGGQNKRKFVHLVCIKMEVNSQRRKMLFFLSTNMAAMTSPANHQYQQAFARCACFFIMINASSRRYDDGSAFHTKQARTDAV